MSKTPPVVPEYPDTIGFGDVMFDTGTHQLTGPCGTTPIKDGRLTHLLRLLMSNPNRLVRNAEILDLFYESHVGVNRDIVKVYISQLRRKIESVCDDAPVIQNVRGEGYILRGNLRG